MSSLSLWLFIYNVGPALPRTFFWLLSFFIPHVSLTLFFSFLFSFFLFFFSCLFVYQKKFCLSFVWIDTKSFVFSSIEFCACKKTNAKKQIISLRIIQWICLYVFIFCLSNAFFSTKIFLFYFLICQSK